MGHYTYKKPNDIDVEYGHGRGFGYFYRRYIKKWCSLSLSTTVDNLYGHDLLEIIEDDGFSVPDDHASAMKSNLPF